MGMFDYVNCDLSLLPVSDEERMDIELGDGGFQSKSFQWPNLDTYDIAPAIDATGCQIFKTSNDWRLPVEERVECQPCKFTGILHFYGDGQSGHWYEFLAEFKDGKLIEITRDLEIEKLYSEL